MTTGQCLILGLERSSMSLRWSGDSQRKSGRFARIDSRESIRNKKLSDSCESSQTCDSQVFSASKHDRKERGSLPEP